MKSIAKLLVTTLICSASLFVIAPKPPAQAAFCICEPGGATTEHTVAGFTCAQAKDKIYGLVDHQIGQACPPGISTCGVNFVATDPCHTLPNGLKQVSGYYVYGCWICEDIPPAP